MAIVGKTLDWTRRLFSEADGVTPSSTRVLMYAFSIFACWLLWRIFYHIFRLTDPTQVSVWLANLPMLVAALIGLIALPYTVNKGTNTLSDVASMFATIKNGTQSLAANSNLTTLAQNVAGVVCTPKTGSAGPKG